MKKLSVCVLFGGVSPEHEVSLRSAESGFTELFEEYGVGKVIFGHLHGAGYFPLQTEKNGVKYYLTSCDKTNFSLTKIE